jgi:hypothetical protein
MPRWLQAGRSRSFAQISQNGDQEYGRGRNRANDVIHRLRALRWCCRVHRSGLERRGFPFAVWIGHTNSTRIPDIPSMITVAMTAAAAAPLIINRSAKTLLTPWAIMMTRAPAARWARTKNTPSQ